ncbi:hypothetical protein HMPREF0297_1329 [Corynebacterium jeikeium ATCC 43734]|nr:hypothetical protein HMPREF0297_1329 [Corynebacterium jeikeium ATCC 43734]
MGVPPENRCLGTLLAWLPTSVIALESFAGSNPIFSALWC